MTTPNFDQISQLKAYFQSKNFFPKKQFGQNFLVDKNYIKIMVDAADVKPNDLILEVGPGGGILTRALIQTSEKVLSVEIDDGLVAMANELIGTHPNFILLHTDIMGKKSQINTLVIDKIKEINPNQIKCVANLPYSIITPFLITMISSFQNLTSFTILIQEEIADKICAKINSNEYGILSVVMQVWGESKILKTVPHQAFWPQPKVTSSIVHSKSKSDQVDFDFKNFALFIKKMFQQRRKKVTHPLKELISKPEEFLIQMGISPDFRPENINPMEWQKIFLNLPKNIQFSDSTESASEDDSSVS